MEPGIKLVEWFDEHYYKIEIDDKVEYLPSTTTKLQVAPKPFLTKWRGDVGNREADLKMYEASERGKRIHYASNLYLNKGMVIYNPYQRPTFTQEMIKELEDKTGKEVFVLKDQDEMYQLYKFQLWIKAVAPVVVATDLIVYDLKAKEAGTIDVVFDIAKGVYDIAGAKPLSLAGGRYIADLKTGNQIDDNYFMQTADYQVMYNKSCKNMVGFVPVNENLIIHTNATTKKGIPGLNTHLRTEEEAKKDYEDFRHIAAIWERTNTNSPKVFEFPNLIRMEE